MQLIYQDRHVDVYHQPGSSQRGMVITFNNMQMIANGETFWGKPVMDKLDLPAIGVMSRARNWFPLSSMEAAAPHVRRHIADHEHVIAYGASMGGYGALKHGKRLGASHAVAFSPQHSIDPSQVHPWDKRYSRYHDPALHGQNMEVAGHEIAGHAHIFFDPFLPSDNRHVQHLVSAKGDVALHRLFCAGHEAVSLFAGTKTIDTLISDVLADDSQAIDTMICTLRRNHKNRRFHLLKTLLFRKKKWDMRAQLAANRDLMEPAMLAELFALSARYAMQRRDYACARAGVMEALAINPQHKTYARLNDQIEARMTAEIAA